MALGSASPLVYRIALACLWCLVVGRSCASPYLESHLVGRRGSVTIQRVYYTSDDLRIEAHLFTPSAPVLCPGIVYAHDGVNGLSHESIDRCAELAAQGYVVLAPSYRGEDGSQGRVEVAAGEVDDVLAAAAALQETPGVDPHRLAAIGTSHGALIVVLAAERSSIFKAIVEGYGVMDIYQWWTYLKSHGYSTDDALSRRVYGRGPHDHPQAFEARNAVTAVGHLQAAVMVVQGGHDTTVPPQQADRFIEVLRAAGKPVEVLRYPTEVHGFLIYPGDSASNQRRADAWAHIRRFLAENIPS